MKVGYVHGAGVRDHAESVEAVRHGLILGAEAAGDHQLPSSLELIAAEYGDVLDSLPATELAEPI